MKRSLVLNGLNLKIRSKSFIMYFAFGIPCNSAKCQQALRVYLLIDSVNIVNMLNLKIIVMEFRNNPKENNRTYFMFFMCLC